jgi:hypothetical protein
MHRWVQWLIHCVNKFCGDNKVNKKPLSLPTLEIKDFSITEGQDAIFTIGTSCAAYKGNKLKLTVGNGTAIAPDDYLLSNLEFSTDGTTYQPFTNGSELSFEPGTDCFYVKVKTVDDNVVDANLAPGNIFTDRENFILTATPVTGFGGDAVVGKAEIIDNDVQKISVVSNGDKFEGDFASWTVSVDKNSDYKWSWAKFNLIDGTTDRATDYDPNTLQVSIDNGTTWEKLIEDNHFGFAFKPNVTSAQVRVKTNTDNQVEGSESLILKVTPNNEGLGHLDPTVVQATLNIKDLVAGAPTTPNPPGTTPTPPVVTPTPPGTTPTPPVVTPPPPETTPTPPVVTPPPPETTPTPPVVTPPPGTTPNVKLVGDNLITEGGAGNYRVELDTVSDKDRTFTITIANGTANRIDLNKGTKLGNATQPAFTGNPDSTLEDQQVAKDFAKWGDIYWKNINTEPNGYQVRDDKDFTVTKSGALNTGDTITVKVKAGEKTSESFKVDAWKENVISPWALLPTTLNANESLYRFYDQENRYIGTGLTSPEASKQREGDETFSVTLTKAEDANIQAAASKIDVSIKDTSKINYISPIALDLNGDGIQTVSVDAGVKFDILNSGIAVQTGWISGSDGFLAIDRNGNGLIDNRSELFGGTVGEGFGTLASFDSNNDGVVDVTDEFFTSLGVWRDANVNGVTDTGEFTSLADAGIATLNTAYSSNFTTDAQGNILGEKSNAITSKGNSIDTVDVYFKLG